MRLIQLSAERGTVFSWMTAEVIHDIIFSEEMSSIGGSRYSERRRGGNRGSGCHG